MADSPDPVCEKCERRMPPSGRPRLCFWKGWRTAIVCRAKAERPDPDPHYRPWEVHRHSKAGGQSSWWVLDARGGLVADVTEEGDARLIVALVNAPKESL